MLWLEADALGIMMGCFTFALIFGGVFWILLFALPYLYSKVKKKFARGFLRHCLYFTGLIEMKGYPTFFSERFIE